MDGLIFYDDTSDMKFKDGVFIAQLPSNISNKKALLNELFDRLMLPDYFGFNWDALDECLNNFEWLNEREVVLVHVDLPELADGELCKYIRILNDAIMSFQESTLLDFKVYFPLRDKLRVLACLSDGSVLH